MKLLDRTNLLVALVGIVLASVPVAFAQENPPPPSKPFPYAFKNDVSLGALYFRGKSGPSLDDTNYAGWILSATHYFNPLIGIAADTQGVYGHAPMLSGSALTSDPLVSQYAYFVGPAIRWRMKPRYSSTARVLVGAATSIFDSDTLGQSPANFGLYPNQTKLAMKIGSNFDLNMSPRVALRISTGTVFERYSGGFDREFNISTGFVYRFWDGRKH